MWREVGAIEVLGLELDEGVIDIGTLTYFGLGTCLRFDLRTVLLFWLSSSPGVPETAIEVVARTTSINSFTL